MKGLKYTKLLKALFALSLFLGLTGVIMPARLGLRSHPSCADTTLADIDSYVATQMAELRIPGLALGIVQGDQVVYLKGLGVADTVGRR
ncbi:MAG: hypothetical protein R2911_44075 [Caldilineaceae bacterium]